MKSAALILLLTCLSPALAGASSLEAAVDQYLQEEMRQQQIPGIALAVVKDGEPVLVKGYGRATLEHAVPVTPDTVFQLGSIGKQFTATAVMMLVNQGKLSLDDPLKKYLPEVPDSWRAVTLRLMLNHQAGIAQFTTPKRQLLDLMHDYTDEELIKLAISQPLDFEPGTDVSYSDTAYVLLGFVINRVAGQFYGDFLQEHVFKPLGMERTRIISDSDIVPDRASGYERRDDGTLRNQTPVSPALNRTADGSLYSTVRDLMKWDRALSGSAVLPHAQLERMWQIDAHKNGERPLYHFGYGWENNHLRDEHLIEYDGNWQGFQAVMSRYSQAHLTVILLTNLALCRTERMGHHVAALAGGAAPYPKTIEDRTPRMTKDFALFLEAARQGFAGGRPKTFSAVRVPATTLKRTLQEGGAIESLTLADDRAAEGARERVYRVETADMVDFYRVRYRGSAAQDLELFREY